MSLSISAKAQEYVNYLETASGKLLLRGYREGFSVDDVNAIADAVRRHTSLSSLTIDGTRLFARGYAFYGEFHAEFTLNHEQDRGGGALFVDRVVSCLRGHSTLTELVLSHLGSAAISWASLGELLSQTPALTHFSLIATLMRGDGFDAFCQVLSSHSSLDSLQLSGSLEPERMEMFSSALAANTSLGRLNLSNNGWVKGGLEYLFQALSTNQTVTTLDISGLHPPFLADDNMEVPRCELGEMLGGMIENNSTLQYVDMCARDSDQTVFTISMMGTKRLTDALSNNTSLSRLSLIAVKIEDMNQMLTSLESQSSLQDLNLRLCTSDLEGFEPLRLSVVHDFMSRNTSLTALNLSQCSYGNAQENPLYAALYGDAQESIVFTAHVWAFEKNGSLVNFNGSTPQFGPFSTELARNQHNTSQKTISLFELLLPFLYRPAKREIAEISGSSHEPRGSSRQLRPRRSDHGSSRTGQGSWT